MSAEVCDLADIDPRRAQIVEFRYFGGCPSYGGSSE